MSRAPLRRALRIASSPEAVSGLVLLAFASRFLPHGGTRNALSEPLFRWFAYVYPSELVWLLFLVSAALGLIGIYWLRQPWKALVLTYSSGLWVFAAVALMIPGANLFGPRLVAAFALGSVFMAAESWVEAFERLDLEREET